MSRDTETNKEDGVDDFLHAQALKAILKGRQQYGVNNVLVLATGSQLILTNNIEILNIIEESIE